MDRALLPFVLLGITALTGMAMCLVDFVGHGLRRPATPRGLEVVFWVALVVLPLLFVGFAAEALRDDAFARVAVTGFLAGVAGYAVMKVALAGMERRDKGDLNSRKRES